MYPLEVLIKKIVRHYETLHSGEMDESKLSEFIQDVSVLQERLHIIRYKGYEEEVRESNNVKNEGFSLNLEPVSKNQISLMDAIEEAQQENEEPEKKPKKQKKTPTVAKKDTQEFPLEESLNEKLSRMQENTPTVAERLQKRPIKDLKTAIGLNDKFLFINELFQQNADIYQDSIHQLNQCTSLNEAMQIIKTEYALKYSWDMESKSATRLVHLVERRYG